MEHVKSSPFRHNFMWPIVVVLAVILYIADMLAAVGQAYVLQNPSATTTPGTTSILHIVMQIGVYGLLAFIFGLVGYFFFIWGTYKIMAHKKLVVDDGHPWDVPVHRIYISGKTLAAAGIMFLLLGVNTETLRIAAIIIACIIFINLPEKVHTKISSSIKSLFGYQKHTEISDSPDQIQ
jgi:hypothetical protein